MDSFVLALRVLVSLGAVLGLIWVLQRRLKRRGSLVRTAAPAISVLSRQGVGHKASVVLLDADGQRLLLGVTEHGVSVLRGTATDDGGTPAPARSAAATPVVADRRSSDTRPVSVPAVAAATAHPFSVPEPVSAVRGRRSADAFSDSLDAAGLHLPAGTAAVTTSISDPDHGSVLLGATVPARAGSRPPRPEAITGEPVRPRGRHAASTPLSPGPLSGSILDLGTWRQARDAARWVAGGRRP